MLYSVCVVFVSKKYTAKQTSLWIEYVQNKKKNDLLYFVLVNESYVLMLTEAYHFMNAV